MKRKKKMKKKNENRFWKKKMLFEFRELNQSRKLNELRKILVQKNVRRRRTWFLSTLLHTTFFSKQKNVKLFVISFENIDDQIQKNTNISIDFKTILSEKFHDIINVFFKRTSNKLTSHRRHNRKIKSKENQKLKHNFFKNISFRKLNFVKKYFENNLKKEFIVVSYTSCFSSILLIKKANDKLWFCVNYRKLNQITKKNKYSILLIIETFAQLFKTKKCFKIKKRQAFYK